MRRVISAILFIMLLAGCAAKDAPAQVAATTLPVYEFTSALCEGTPVSVTRLVTEKITCLHDYSLNVRQVKAAEAADVIVISGAGLEEFLEDMLSDMEIIDASAGIDLICPDEDGSHDHADGHAHHHEDHHHEEDPHIWLSPAHAKVMAQNICNGLSSQYPEHAVRFAANLEVLLAKLDFLQTYGEEQLAELSCREIITFHDGFAYFAEAFDLTILEAVEEESGSEASAKELIHLIEEVEHHQLPAIFTELNGSVSAADIISRETGAACYPLDMAMSGESWFDAMYHNINIIKEALE